MLPAAGLSSMDLGPEGVGHSVPGDQVLAGDARSKPSQTRLLAEAGPAEDVAAVKAAAREALGAGRWEEAREGFAAVLEMQESGEALFGLALALWWLGDPVSSISLQERAFGLFRGDEGPLRDNGLRRGRRRAEVRRARHL